jgi:hypothetical protein
VLLLAPRDSTGTNIIPPRTKAEGMEKRRKRGQYLLATRLKTVLLQQSLLKTASKKNCFSKPLLKTAS